MSMLQTESSSEEQISFGLFLSPCVC